MTWERTYRLRHSVRTSLVPPTILALTAALVCAPAVRWLDDATGWQLFRFSVEGARALLQALAGSMMTFFIFVLSALLVVVQLAMAQLTPRVLGVVLSRPTVKVILAMIMFTFVYTLGALGRIDDHVPDLHVGVAVVLNLACMGAFTVFVQQISHGLRPTAVMRVVAEQGLRVIRTVYPKPYDTARPERTVRELLPSTSAEVVNSARPSGVVMAFSVEALVRIAAEADVVLELVPEVGDHIADGDPLLRIFGESPSIPPDALRGCVAIGDERTLEQDPRFALRILVDIAIKALSPGINDPTTAVLALDQIDQILLAIGRRHLDDGHAHDREGKLRLVYSTPGWPDYVLMAVSEIRHYGGTSLQIDRRLGALLNHLIEALPEARWPPLIEELRLLETSVRRGFSDAEESKRAQIDDVQGLGGTGPRRRLLPNATRRAEARPGHPGEGPRHGT